MKFTLHITISHFLVHKCIYFYGHLSMGHVYTLYQIFCLSGLYLFSVQSFILTFSFFSRDLLRLMFLVHPSFLQLLSCICFLYLFDTFFFQIFVYLPKTRRLDFLLSCRLNNDISGLMLCIQASLLFPMSEVILSTVSKLPI